MQTVLGHHSDERALRCLIVTPPAPHQHRDRRLEINNKTLQLDAENQQTTA